MDQTCEAAQRTRQLGGIEAKSTKKKLIFEHFRNLQNSSQNLQNFLKQKCAYVRLQNVSDCSSLLRPRYLLKPAIVSPNVSDNFVSLAGNPKYLPKISVFCRTVQKRWEIFEQLDAFVGQTCLMNFCSTSVTFFMTGLASQCASTVVFFGSKVSRMVIQASRSLLLGNLFGVARLDYKCNEAVHFQPTTYM